MFLDEKWSDVAFFSIKDDADEPDVLSRFGVFLRVTTLDDLLNGLFIGSVGFELKDECVLLVGKGHIHATLACCLFNTYLYPHRGKKGIDHRGVEAFILVDVVFSVPVAWNGGEETSDGCLKQGRVSGGDGGQENVLIALYDGPRGFFVQEQRSHRHFDF